ncbi:porin OmpA [Alishewanella longhuensis]|uniref:Porin OmpA n=1 Tax=Alishewanella longhuensis TaxID=1091037 RepID=A0ABQ3KXX7_9ALTE|nr:OmpA family protein [Alishewanella longhuensis]GHG63203.1 porin OmpA [Alishewanella longhuensis]
MKNLMIRHDCSSLLAVNGCLLLMLSFNSLASSETDYKANGWHVGINLGQSSAKIDGDSIKANLENTGFDVNALNQDRHDQGYKLYAGYKFSSYFVLEAGYFDLGRFSFNANTLPVSNYTGRTGVKGWNLDLVGILPISDSWSVLARVGVTRNDTKTRFSSNGLINTSVNNQDNSYTKHKFGLGVQYDISDAFIVRLEAERYRMDDLVGNDGDVDLYTLGVVYRFGSRQPQPVPTTTPEPLTRVATEQVTQASPVIPEPEVLVLEDVHFNFDTAELNNDTKVMLRRHATTLKANPKARVRIAGYTSASGSAAYNQALSERRAESIKAFLVSEGINANRFKTIGFGQRNPAKYEAKPSALQSDAAKANMRGLFEIIIE